MKHKVSDLEGALLDAAVAKALDMRSATDCFDVPFDHGPSDDQMYGDAFTPSARWDHAGPIIEMERISLKGCEGGGWSAYFDHPTERDATAGGATPLIAAMRAYVASKFGDTVELP